MTQEEVIYKNNILDEITKPITTLTVIASCISIRGDGEGDYALIRTRDKLESCYFEVGSQLQVIEWCAFYQSRGSGQSLCAVLLHYSHSLAVQIPQNS